MRIALTLALALVGCHREPARVPPTPIDPPAPPPTVADPAAPAAPPSERLTAPPVALTAAIQLERFASGLRRPVALVAAPGDPPSRLYVVEQPGTIRVLIDGRPQPTPLLDLSREVSTGNEQGLLGLAFHPDFATNRRLFVNYTDGDGDTHVVEYQVRADDRLRVDPASARELLRIEQPYSNHNGGHLVIGPDRQLWIGTGDGGAAGDPRDNGQDPDALLGKMLRLDPDRPGARPEIVALGLRNPWRYAFDAATGDLYIADVGQNEWEQLYVVPAARTTGHNFGWNRAEGRHCYDAATCDRSAFTAPVTDYPHADGCSVTGGLVYRGRALPELDGVYFYADYCTAFIRSFRWRADGIRDHWDWKAALDPGTTLAQVSSFGVDHAGELYLLTLGGDVWRFARR